MDKQTFEALTVLMEKLDKHVIHATYQEEAKEAYKRVMDWMEEVAKDYND